MLCSRRREDSCTHYARIVDPPEQSEAPLKVSQAPLTPRFPRRGSFTLLVSWTNYVCGRSKTSKILWYSPPTARTNNEETPGIDGPDSFAFLMSCQTPESHP